MWTHWIKATPTSLLLALALAPACAPVTPPIQTLGQAASGEGVAFEVERQSCTASKDPAEPHSALIEARVRVRVRNQTGAPVTVRRDQFRLQTPAGGALKTMTVGAAEPLTVPTGEDAAFNLRFVTRDAPVCAGDLSLVAPDAFAIDGRSVAIGAVSFVPRQTL
jgi:hypothetical protein